MNKARDIRVLHPERGSWHVFWKRGRSRMEYIRWFPNEREAKSFIAHLDQRPQV
jgi:hypothetical protein